VGKKLYFTNDQLDSGNVENDSSTFILSEICSRAKLQKLKEICFNFLTLRDIFFVITYEIFIQAIIWSLRNLDRVPHFSFIGRERIVLRFDAVRCSPNLLGLEMLNGHDMQYESSRYQTLKCRS
jgi:hypothetical protein